MFTLALIALTAAFPGDGEAVLSPDQVSEVDAINCRIDVSTYLPFAMAVAEGEIAEQRGWRRIEGANPYLSEFELPAPITVAGTHSTRRIAFSGHGILAVLNVEDPATVASGEQVENELNADLLVDALAGAGAVTRAQAEAEIKFRKFLGERIVHEVTEQAEEGEEFGVHKIVARSISNVVTHPGKTLYGCSYRFKFLNTDGEPL